MAGSPDSKPGIVQFAIDVSKLIKENPITSVATTLVTVAALHGATIWIATSVEAGPDLWLKPNSLAKTVGFPMESPEHKALRSRIMTDRYNSDLDAAITYAGIAGGIALIPVLRPWARRQPPLQPRAS